MTEQTSAYRVVDMTHEEYEKAIKSVVGHEDEFSIDEEGGEWFFRYKDGRSSDDEGEPFPYWFRELPWSELTEEVEDANFEPNEHGYARIDGDSTRLYELLG